MDTKGNQFYLFFKNNTFIYCALLKFHQPTQIQEVIEFLGNGFLETISFWGPKLLWYIGKNGREKELEHCQIEIKHQ